MGKTGFEHVKIGDKTLTGKYIYIDKQRISFFKCPICKSSKTYHRQMSKLGIAANVWNLIGRHIDADLYSLEKYNMCLRCAHIWIFEYYIYKKTKVR